MSLITHPNARELTKSVRATVLVFKDPRSQELLSRIERLAPSEANTLIIGETGTGKELWRDISINSAAVAANRS